MSSSNKPLRNKLVVSLLFTKNSGRMRNLITHLRINHPTNLEDVGRGAKDRNSLRLRVIDEAIRNIFRCYEWVVMDRLPLSLVERKMMRKNASLTPIAKKTLKRGTLAEDDPDYFEGTDCYTRRFQLLAFWPLKVEEDLGAQSLFDLIADTLSRYNKPWDAVHFMVADNCSVNQYIGSREGGLPM
ncbi:hypothetical protein F442_02002, partial [Phytophthora nicotianae P10297]